MKYSFILFNRILYLIKNHDTLIDVDSLNNNDLPLINKLLNVQYADAKAHNPTKVQKRLKILDDISKDIENKFSISL